MTPIYHQLQESETGRIVVARMTVADTVWKRTIGLLGRAALAEDEGLWIAPCNGIHTLGMRFALDVVFLNREGCAIRLAPHVRPWRFCGPVRRARAVLELPAGAIKHLDLRADRHYKLAAAP